MQTFKNDNQKFNIDYLLYMIHAGDDLIIYGLNETIKGQVRSTTEKNGGNIVILDDKTRRFRNINEQSLKTITAITRY